MSYIIFFHNVIKVGNLLCKLKCTRCPRMSAHILNIFIEKINRAKRVQFSLHDNGTVKVLYTILVLYSILLI
jgi:hypothetical protein